MFEESVEEICLVEVKIMFVKKGDIWRPNHIDDYIWENSPEIEPVGEGHIHNVLEVSTRPDVFIAADNVAYKFRFFGQGTNDSYTNALEWVSDTIGNWALFKDSLDALHLLGLTILNESNKLQAEAILPEKPASEVNFITAWRYYGFQESDDTWAGAGSWGEEWKLLGLVDLDRLPIVSGIYDRVEQALQMAFSGVIDGARDKKWIIDQMVRCLTGSGYDELE